jgi:protein O-mannosyl-transferase
MERYYKLPNRVFLPGGGELHLILRDVLFVLLFAVIMNGNIFNAEFTLDDKFSVSENPCVQSKPMLWSQLFSRDYWGHRLSLPDSHKSFRPLTTFSFWVNVWIFHKPYFHLTNCLLHSLSCILTYILAVKNGFSRNSSLFGALLFATHPVNCESVANLSGRAEILCGIFSLLTCAVFQQLLLEKNIMIGVVLICVGVCTYACAALSKEIGAVSVIMMSVIYYDVSNPKKHACIILCSMLALALRFAINRGLPVFSEMDNPLQNYLGLPIMFINCVAFWVLVMPQTLCADYSAVNVATFDTFLDARIALMLITVVPVVVVAVYTPRSRYTKFALLWILVFYLPAMNLFIRVGFLIAERTLYMPAIGYSLFVAHWLSRGLRSSPYNAYFYRGAIILTALLCIFSIQKTARNSDWHTNGRLWAAEVGYCRHNARAFNNLGKALQRQGKIVEARKMFYRAIQIYPKFATPFFNLGLIAQMGNRVDLAILFYKRAIHILPDFVGAIRNLGMCYHRKGKLKHAMLHFKKSLRLNPCDDKLNLFVRSMEQSNTNLMRR